jgi:hypothetical protein
MEQEKLDVIYSTLQLMNENAIVEFIIKVETLNLDAIKDKTIILKYIDMIVNYTKICKQLHLNEEYAKKLKDLKLNLIKYLNLMTYKEQGL